MLSVRRAAILTLLPLMTALVAASPAGPATASYSAWWEIIPAPSLTISTLSVHPGDHMHANIAELVPFSEVWTITLQDVSTGQSFTQTVPYPSSHLTAEWITETPTLISTS